MSANGTVAEQTSTSDMLLDARDIQKSFGPTRVLRGTNFSVAAGEIHALLGGNGAGKSTLIKIISGSERRDGGTLCLAGKNVDGAASDALASVGVVHQELALFPHLSVAENIYLPRLKNPAGTIDFKAAASAGRRALSNIDPVLAKEILHKRVIELNLHERQLVEIARVLDVGAQLILLDEPTANLTGAEALKLFAILKQLAKTRGVGIVFVSHRMQEIRQVADVCTVIRDGSTVVFREPVSELSDEHILTAIGGLTRICSPKGAAAARDRAAEPTVEAETSDTGTPTTTYRWSSDPGVADFKLGAIRVILPQSMILGLAGTPVGPMHLIRGLIGLRSAKSSSLTVGAHTSPPRSPAKAVRERVGFVSGDRSKGLFPTLPIVDNICASARVLRRSITTTHREAQEARTAVQRLNMRLSSVWASPSTLSGGTQQKVIIARWLSLKPKLLVLEEPTRGVDAATKADLYAIIRELAQAGTSVIWWSTEHSELVQLCDAVLAFNLDGTPKRVLSGSTLTEEALADATGMVA
jgi:ribose transport system ATP-binding protein